MKIIKYLSVALCLVTVLCSTIHAADFDEHASFQAISFKLPSLKKMFVFSLVAFSNTVDAAPWRPASDPWGPYPTTPTRAKTTPTARPLDPPTPSLAPTVACHNECFPGPNPALPCVKRPVPTTDESYVRIMNCLIPLACKDCNDSVKISWASAGYADPLPGQVEALTESARRLTYAPTTRPTSAPTNSRRPTPFPTPRSSIRTPTTLPTCSVLLGEATYHIDCGSNCQYPPNRYGNQCTGVIGMYHGDSEAARKLNCLVPFECRYCDPCVKQRWYEKGYRSDELA